MNRPVLNGLTTAVRGIWGVALLVVPTPVLASVIGGRPSAAQVGVARVLGARHLAQALVVAKVPEAARVGVLVDALHSMSMVALAVAVPSQRRPAAASASVAAGLGLADHGSLREQV